MRITSIILLLLSLASTVSCISNGLGITPQMGWNSWNHFRCNLTETLVLDQAKALITTGLASAGYNRVNLDDCWQVARSNITHEIIADPERFPHGIQWLAQQIHEMGLLFGLYSDAGEFTCQHRPGSLGYELIDAQTYSDWQVDYLKYDNCFNNNLPPQPRYEAMAKALESVPHKIFFSLCDWGSADPATWAPALGNSWRTTQDIKPFWSRIRSNILANNQWAKYAAPGGWNDPDMLEVGNFPLLPHESESHFFLWCISKAPLILGNDLTSMDQFTLKLLSNPEAIAVNQDSLGVQGAIIAQQVNGTGELWAGPLAGNSSLSRANASQATEFAVVLINVGEPFSAPISVQLLWSQLPTPFPSSARFSVRDLGARSDLGIATGSFKSRPLNPRESQFIRLTLTQ